MRAHPRRYLDFVGRLWIKLGGVGAMCLIFVLGASLYRGRTKWVQLVKVMARPHKAHSHTPPTLSIACRCTLFSFSVLCNVLCVYCR